MSMLPAGLKRGSKGGTLSKPARDESIRNVAKVLHRHILQKDVRDPVGHEQQKAFDIDNFVRRSYNVAMPPLPTVCGYTVFVQKQRVNRVPVPDVQKIFKFIKRIYEKARLNIECVIITLIYVERLMEMRALNLGARNWIPIVATAMLTASKVWDDHSSWNSEFTAILPMFKLQDINQLEREFLDALNFYLYISSGEYAKYYFGLRALRRKEVRHIPKYYLKLNLGAGRVVQKKSIHSESVHRDMPMSM